MEDIELLKAVKLCHLPLFKLRAWLKENDLVNKDLSEIKNQWKQALENNPVSFFIDTELLIKEKDIIMLQVQDNNVVEYLAKTYQIKEQQICQKLFGENKHLILLTKEQWRSLNSEPVANKEKGLENCAVLFKDETTIKSKLTEWLKGLPQTNQPTKKA